MSQYDRTPIDDRAPIFAEDLMEITQTKLKKGDRYIGEVDINPGATRYEWWAIICRYRPGGKIPMFYKVRCWDSVTSSYHPDIPHGPVPTTHVIKNAAKSAS